MDDIALQSASSQAEAIRTRQISARELLDTMLQRVERLNPALNAVVTLDVEGAHAAAAAADRTAPAGPLHGLPVTIKDAIATEGIRSTGGAVELRDHIPAADAPSVARLRDAGAVVFGKTNCPRWSGDIQTFNELFGTTNNPWDVSRVPGGSSGGAAAAVAAGLSVFELGTDIGGSVRIPSHFCGVCGHKPSFGVISQRGYLDYPLGGSTDADINVFGPLARTVDDLSLLLDVLAAPDADRAKAWRLDLPDPRHSTLDGYRIGTWLDDPACEVDTEMGDILEAAADALRSAGAKVDDARPPLTIGESLEVFMPLISAAVSPSMPAEVADAVSGSHLSWLEHDRRRAILRAKWADWFTAHDILLCPVVPSPAFAHDQAGSLFDRHVTINGTSRPHVDFIAWTGLVGVAYLPSTVVPVGWTATGLPVGIQVVAPFLEDRTGLFVAAALEHLLGGYRPPPLAL